jgi:hypothetical protein
MVLYIIYETTDSSMQCAEEWYIVYETIDAWVDFRKVFILFPNVWEFRKLLEGAVYYIKNN